MAAPKFASVDEYLASLDDTKASTMRHILDAVLAVSADLHPVIAWNVPQVKNAGGKYVFGMSAAKNHISLAPWSNEVVRSLSNRLASYDHTEAMIRVPVTWSVDTALIRDLVTGRMAELNG